MKTKEVKRKEAEERQKAYSALTDKEKIAKGVGNKEFAKIQARKKA